MLWEISYLPTKTLLLKLNMRFLDDLWDGCEADDAIMNHFFCDILPLNDLSNRIDKISVPVLLAA